MSDRIADPGQPPENLRDAYFRRYPEARAGFERHLLLKGMGLRSRVLFWILGGFRPHSFNPDRALVDSLASVRGFRDLESRMDEFHDQNRIDRSFRRRFLGIRVSHVRLRRILEPLISGIVAPKSSAEIFAAAGIGSVGTGEGGGKKALRPADLRSVGRNVRNASAEAEARAKELKVEIDVLRRRIAELTAELDQLKR